MELIHGDCLCELKKMPSDSVDACITDPPYFLAGLGDEWSRESIAKRTPASDKGAVVQSLPAGMKFDKNQGKRFRAFYENVSREIYRVLKPGGFFFSFSAPRLYHAMATAMDEAGFEIRDMLGWVHAGGMMKAFSHAHFVDKMDVPDEEKRRIHERVRGLKTPQLKPCIEPIAMGVKPLDGTYVQNELKHSVGMMNAGTDAVKVGVGQKYAPANVLTVADDEGLEDFQKVFMVPKPTKAEKGEFNEHVSVKPVAIVEHLINLFTKPGALVLDPFLGSGTTAVACQNKGRRCVGVEIDAHYLDIAQRRIQDKGLA